MNVYKRDDIFGVVTDSNPDSSQPASGSSVRIHGLSLGLTVLHVFGRVVAV